MPEHLSVLSQKINGRSANFSFLFEKYSIVLVFMSLFALFFISGTLSQRYAIPIAGHRHSGIRYLSPVPERSGGKEYTLYVHNFCDGKEYTLFLLLTTGIPASTILPVVTASVWHLVSGIRVSQAPLVTD